MSRLTIEESESPYGIQYRLEYPFDAMDRLIRTARPGQRLLLFGASVWEEARYRRFSTTTFGGRFIYPFAAAGIPRKAARRVESFLSNHADFSVFGASTAAEAFERTAALDEKTLIDILANRFVETRRTPGDAYNEMTTYLREFLAQPVSGECVLYVPFFDWRSLVVHALWTRNKHPSTLIFATDADDAAALRPIVDGMQERDYIPLEDLLGAVSDHFGLPEQVILNALRRFEKSDASARRYRDIDTSRLTLSGCEAFISSVPLLVGEQATDLVVPTQVAAPLRFSSDDGKIDILESHQYSVDDPILIGAARGALNQAGDLASYPGFGNAIPNFDRRLARITAVLERVASRDYDDTLIVQLGTEVVGLEHVVNCAREMLGESAHSEAAAFFAVIFGFLSQYAGWTEYKAHAAQLRTADAQASYDVAREILASFSSDMDTATSRARQRVSEYIAGIPRGEVQLQRDGAISSTENVLASATGHLVRTARTAATKLEDKIIDKATDEASAGIVSFLSKNSEKIAVFAQKAAIPWLIDLCKQWGLFQ